MPKTGLICGFAEERKIAALWPDSLVAVSGARPDLARLRAKELIGQGATRLLSFGIAGGLDPAARTGDVFVASRVIGQNASWTCDSDWSAFMASKLGQVDQKILYGSDTVLASVQDKRRAFDLTRAFAVDMESQCVAAVAEEAGIPFAVLRVIADPAAFSLPPAAAGAIKEDGSTDFFCVLRALAKSPRQLPDLLHLGRLSATALRALDGAVLNLGIAAS